MSNSLKAFIFLILTGIYSRAHGQSALKFSGFVQDSINQEPIAGALIEFKENSLVVSSDSNGYFAAIVPKGLYSIEISFLGYHKKNISVLVEKEIHKNILLHSSAKRLSELSVIGDNQKENIQNAALGNHRLSMKEINQLPKLLGEADPIKAIQLLPGIQTSGEGNTGFHVRGGGMDQNLILIDDVPIYNAGHLFGFFSIFNANAIDEVSITKAAMPANYGGRLASVLDIKTKTGDLKKLKTRGGIGLLASNITVEGPIKKDTCSFIISARRTYVDAFKSIINKNSRYTQDYFFYDINAKLFLKLSDKDRIYFTAYKGLDDFKYNDAENNYYSNDIAWGTSFGSVKWSHLFNNKLSVNLSSSISYYNMDFLARIFSYSIRLQTKIDDISNKISFVHIPHKKHVLKYGLEQIYHKIAPNNIEAAIKGEDFNIKQNNLLNSAEYALFINDEFKLNERLLINSGLRYSLYHQLGPFNRFNSDANGQTIDTSSYSKNKVIQAYKNLEPRFSCRYLLDEHASLKISYTQNYQYIHLAPVSSISLPTDVWVPSSSLIKPQFGQQYAIGYFKDLIKPSLSLSCEAYYKTMENVLEYKEGILSVQNFRSNYDQNFFFGRGKSYGLEFFIKKTAGKYNGWISYTLSKSIRSFDNIEAGRYFYAKHDRRHDLSITNSFQINEKWSVAAVFVYATGNAMTLPVSRYLIQGNVINTYSERNAFRMPAYHRMDVSLTYLHKKTERWESEWNFSIYNIYNRQNPYYIFFQTNGSIKNYSLAVNIKPVSLFPVVPSLSWKFNF